MLFCSSASNAGAAWASVNSRGEFAPLAEVSESCLRPEGKWVVRYQNPPTSRTTRNKRRSFMVLKPKTFPYGYGAGGIRFHREMGACRYLILPVPILETQPRIICCSL